MRDRLEDTSCKPMHSITPLYESKSPPALALKETFHITSPIFMMDHQVRIEIDIAAFLSQIMAEERILISEYPIREHIFNILLRGL